MLRTSLLLRKTLNNNIKYNTIYVSSYDLENYGTVWFSTYPIWQPKKYEYDKITHLETGNEYKMERKCVIDNYGNRNSYFLFSDVYDLFIPSNCHKKERYELYVEANEAFLPIRIYSDEDLKVVEKRMVYLKYLLKENNNKNKF